MNQSVLNQARIDKFNLLMDIPLALKKTLDPILKTAKNPNTIQFTVFGSPVPAMKIAPINLPFGGQSYNTSSNSRGPWPPLDLKLVIDNGYQNYWILWNWLNLFNDSSTGHTDMISRPSPFEDKDYITNIPFTDYVCDFVLYALDEYNNNIMAFKYKDAFITGLSEINFTHQDENILTSTVSFAYNQMTPQLLNNVSSISQ